MRSTAALVMGAALLLGSCLPVPVREAATGVPGPAVAPAAPGPAASTRFGFRLVAGPAPVRDGETAITVAADRDLALIALMVEKGDAGGNAVPVPVDTTGTGIWTLKPVFPRVATYVITLHGKPAGDPSDTCFKLAEWAVDATSARAAAAPAGRPAAAAGSGWFREYPALKEYGLAVVEAPGQDTVGAETLIVVSSDQELELSAAVWRPGSTTSVGGATRVERTGNTWRCRVAFPESGEYSLSIGVRRPGAGEKTYRGAAEWRVRAEVEPGARVTLWPEPSPVAGSGQAAAAAAAKAAFTAAIEAGNLPRIKACLEGCASRDVPTRAVSFQALEAGLFETGRSRTAEVLGLLAAAGLDPNLVDEDGATILQSAVDHDRMDVAAWLLERGADVNARGPYRTTALHALASVMDNPVAPGRHVDWLRLFLGYGVDLDARTDHGDTALCDAAQRDRLHELVVALVESGADFDIGDEEGNAPRSGASQHNAAKNLKYLTAKGARLYSYEFPTANDAPPCRAVLSGDLAAIGSLPREEFGRMLARTSMAVPATALHLAAEQGSLPVLRALCARKVDWNVPDRYGCTPLQLAVTAGRGDAVTLLLDHGADPNLPSSHRATPFTVACATRPEIAMQMLARGLAPRGEGLEAAAIGSENLQLVKALGGRVAWSPSGLRLAAEIGQVEITEHLCALVSGKIGRVQYFEVQDGRVEDRELGLPQLVEQARKNRQRNELYLQQSARPLEAPRRSGGIAARRGAFPYVVESWSPWLPGGTARLADCPVGVYVPKSYDGRRPFGLVVSMTNAKSSSSDPRGFTATLDRHDLIWAGFDPYKGLEDANTAFCLAIVYNLLGCYNIDQSRIYVGGYSLGGQLTEDILKSHPWVFDGAFFINMSYTGGLPSRPEWYHVKNRLPVVIVEGDYDYNRVWAYREYDELLCRGYRDLHFSHEPMKGHTLISAASFERIVSLLEAARR